MQTTQFDLSPAEQRRLQRFKDLIWNNSEVCNECFTRVREVERNPARERLAETSLHNPPAEFHERTEDARAEWCGWDNTDRYGTTFCLECGSDLSAQSRTRSLEQLKEPARNLVEYTIRHTDLDISGRELGAELCRLKSIQDLQGLDTEIVAVAWIRSISIPTSVTADAQGDRHAPA